MEHTALGDADTAAEVQRSQRAQRAKRQKTAICHLATIHKCLSLCGSCQRLQKHPWWSYLYVQY